jgi:hypothetical protein
MINHHKGYESKTTIYLASGGSISVFWGDKKRDKSKGKDKAKSIKNKKPKE